MKKYIVIFGIFFGTAFSHAQRFKNGRAVYKFAPSKLVRARQMKIIENEKIPAEAKQKSAIEIEEAIWNRYYTLQFDSSASVFDEQKKLSKPGPDSDNIIMTGAVLTSYKDNKTYSTQFDLGGKLFLIVADLPKRKWKLHKETKKIGKYLCRKATYTKETEVSKSLFKDFDSPGEEIMMDTETIKKKVVTTAWYAPKIPVSTGPEDYVGLPGLILELHDTYQSYYCTEIVINPKNGVKIKKPTKGKVVTPKEFQEINDKFIKDSFEMDS